MATAPKAAPKAVPKVVPIDDSAAAAQAPKKSRKTLIIAGVLMLVTAAAGGGAAYWFTGSAAEDKTAAPKAEPVKPPVFVMMDSFTVNLQPEDGVDQYLQLAFSLQVADQATVDQIKLYMPQVRSRLLMLLSSKKASELSTVDGKKKLSDEIIAQVKQPFSPQGKPQAVTGVFFTSFVIQ
jgi:flagellar FliL protein